MNNKNTTVTPTTFFDMADLRRKLEADRRSEHDINTILVTSIATAQLCATTLDHFIDDIIQTHGLTGIPANVAEGIVVGVAMYLETLAKVVMTELDVKKLVELAKLVNVISAADVIEAAKAIKQ